MKKLLTSPQVIAALITSTVAITLALLPMLRDNQPSSANIVEAIPTTVEPTQTMVVEATAIEATNTPPPTDQPPSSIPTVASKLVPTNTSVPIQAPTDTQPPNVLLLYDDFSFTIYNQGSQTLAFDTVRFQSTSGRWDAEQWGVGLAQSFPPDNCLRMRDATSASQQPPAICGTLLGLQLTSGDTLFWLNTDVFDVLHNGDVIATCATTDDTCAIFVPSE